MLRPNSISLSTFHSTVENMSGIAEAVHFPLSTRLYKAWKGGKETAGQKEEGTKAVSHHVGAQSRLVARAKEGWR